MAQTVGDEASMEEEAAVVVAMAEVESVAVDAVAPGRVAR